ncbi:hypothetical protein [Nocardia pseudobrasiliensis]|uniref:Uncharacterized protein n=1 Tax=Nocardia pseudobrasiliensis TaxID=45979 RepID=A0A370IBG7_9NOCA|nr:hypothetical protein [Nocardia pseudobrasiliensis]RDI66734.1 hypothetical protein DFR76_104484 [Nocardia pseudobrasiliensis]
MNIDYDTVRVSIHFENGSDDPNDYPYYDHCAFDPGPLTPEQAHRLLQIHLHNDSVQCKQKHAALSTLEAAGRLHRATRSVTAS